jgi:hypothetical protein
MWENHRLVREIVLLTMNEKGNIENVKKKHCYHCWKVNVPRQVCFKILDSSQQVKKSCQ